MQLNYLVPGDNTEKENELQLFFLSMVTLVSSISSLCIQVKFTWAHMNLLVHCIICSNLLLCNASLFFLFSLWHYVDSLSSLRVANSQEDTMLQFMLCELCINPSTCADRVFCTLVGMYDNVSDT